MRHTGQDVQVTGIGLSARLAILVIIGLSVISAKAATVRVPDDQPTIQAGIDAASNGDVVLVAPGWYAGVGNRDITFDGKGITLRSSAGPASTVINCQGQGRAFILRGSVAAEPTIEGFTIVNGYGGHQGGAIECFGFSPTVRNCIFADCRANYGGALYFNGKEQKSTSEISSYPVIENCTFYGNVANFRGSVFFSNFGVDITFTNCLMAFNSSEEDPPVSWGDGGSTIALHCTDLWGNTPGDWIGNIEGQLSMNGNFAMQPMFCAAEYGHFGLEEASPLLPENSPCGQLVGAVGAGCDDCFDYDGDDVCALDDNCVYHYNPFQEDTDSDGIGDVCADDDEDGILNAFDNCPYASNYDQRDIDGDGLGDVCDPDVDGDDIDNGSDNCPRDWNPVQDDLDSDGIGDRCDDCPIDPHNDIDGDGICVPIDNCPELANPEQEDLDGDGLGDDCDPDWDGDLVDNESDNCPRVDNPLQEDADLDGTGDACDQCPEDLDNDFDGDGVCAPEDNCSGDYNPEQADMDLDGVGDVCDDDIDGDGLDNDDDNCPRTHNPDQTDDDQNGVGDVCEDYDNDGVTSDVDNCPWVANPDQGDLDQDGVGDACDDDIDGDGLTNEADNCPEKYNPDQIDLNNDGVGDICCCDRRVGDANGLGGDEPTIGDVAVMVDAKFVTGTCDGIIVCLLEADINYSGGCAPTCNDITIGDLSILIDYLFATCYWYFPDCLECPEPPSVE